MEWLQDDQDLFDSLVYVTTKTSLTPDQIRGFCTDEYERLLTNISNFEKAQNEKLFNLIDYYILRTAETEKDADRKSNNKRAQEIRDFYTGKEKTKTQSTNFDLAPNVGNVEALTGDDFEKFKEEYENKIKT
jgi:hypothetical protein